MGRLFRRSIGNSTRENVAACAPAEVQPGKPLSSDAGVSRRLCKARMKASTRVVHVSLADALSKGPPPPGNLAVPIFSRGSLVVELYTPDGHDPQKPHTRDEVYFVTRGNGLFFDVYLCLFVLFCGVFFVGVFTLVMLVFVLFFGKRLLRGACCGCFVC